MFSTWRWLSLSLSLWFWLLQLGPHGLPGVQEGRRHRSWRKSSLRLGESSSDGFHVHQLLWFI